jgi:ABC-type branched-subunit amino acid transport system substrate-binding protein
MRKSTRLVVAVLCFVFAIPFLNAEVPGINSHEIVIGSCSVLDGPASQLGQQLVMGATAYINMVNASGGVNGRKIVLHAYEDAYDPDKATTCFARLQQEKVFAAAFFVGTPTAARYVPLAESNHIPLVGLFTGAELLYNPFHHYVVNVRASYFDETRVQVDNLWEQGIRKIAVIYPSDAFGAAVLDGVKASLKKHSATVVAAAVYPRNTPQIDSAMATVRAARPEAVVLVGPYTPVAAVLRKAWQQSWNPMFLAVSFVGSDDLIREAGSAAEGAVITQVMPSYSAVDLPTVALYRKQLSERFPSAKPGYVSLEGFVDAMVLVEGLKRAGSDLTREKLIVALESMHAMDLGLGPQLTLNLSATNHKGSQTVYSTVVRDGAAVPFTDWRGVVSKKRTNVVVAK